MKTFIKIENGVVSNILQGPDIDCPEGYEDWGNKPLPKIGENLVEAIPEPVRTPVAPHIMRRKHSYPSAGELLDMLWHGMDADPSKRIEPFYGAVLAIKTAIPITTNDQLLYEEIEI